MSENLQPENVPVVRVLPPLEFDFATIMPLPAHFGKSESAVTILPPVTFDFKDAVKVPYLKLALYLRPDADPATLPLDVLRFIEVVNRHERQLGGRGLSWHHSYNQATPGSGIVRLLLTPFELPDAPDRLAKLAQLVTAAATSQLKANGLAAPSFARWEAAVGGLA